jgi:phenylalanyl-tRNA synthetase alpha chain
MKEALEQIRSEALAALAAGGDEAAIEALRVRYLGRKGELTGVMRQLRDVPTEQRPAMGVLLNQIKDEIEARIGDASPRRGPGRAVSAPANASTSASRADGRRWVGCTR